MSRRPAIFMGKHMKFYAIGNVVVWNKFTQKALCRFKNGEYETADAEEIRLLVALGYESDEGNNLEVEQDVAESGVKPVEPEPINTVAKKTVQTRRSATKTAASKSRGIKK